MYSEQGRYEQAAQVTIQAEHLAPSSVAPYDNLANDLIALQRFEESRRTIQDAHANHLEEFTLHGVLYALAFIAGDTYVDSRTATLVLGQPCG